MDSPSSFPSLSQVIDDAIDWLVVWHRLAFVELGTRSAQAKSFALPPSFTAWHLATTQQATYPQPALERVTTTQEQLHTLVRLVLMKTPDAAAVTHADHLNVIAKYQEYLQGLRRLERAFTAASSGLDVLTGLRSRVGLQDDLRSEYNRFLRNAKPFCVALMDIDHFKSVNDRYGHDAGDRVLAAVADHVSRHLRPFDDAYRWGGEEFLLCLKETDLTVGLTILERLRSGLEKMVVPLADGQTLTLTASFGYTVSTKTVTSDQMPLHADEALYRAKHSGRNRIVAAEVTA